MDATNINPEVEHLPNLTIRVIFCLQNPKGEFGDTYIMSPVSKKFEGAIVDKTWYVSRKKCHYKHGYNYSPKCQ